MIIMNWIKWTILQNEMNINSEQVEGNTKQKRNLLWKNKLIYYHCIAETNITLTETLLKLKLFKYCKICIKHCRVSYIHVFIYLYIYITAVIYSYLLVLYFLQSDIRICRCCIPGPIADNRRPSLQHYL